MKTEMIIACSILAGAILCGQTNGIDSNAVILPDDLPLSTRLKLERAPEYAKLSFMAYRNFPKSSAFYTLGLLVRMSDSIAIVKVTNVTVLNNYTSTAEITVTFSPERTLFGKPRKKKTTMSCIWLGVPKNPLPREGDRLLVFIADDDHLPNLFIAHDWKFNKNEHKALPRKAPAFPEGSRSIFSLNGDEQERELLAAVEELLLNLRRGSRNRERYYTCLLKQTRSPVERVSNDAHYDLLDFIRFEPSLDLRRILAADAVPECVKEYIRLIQIPEREKAEREKAEQKKTGQQEPQ